MVLGLRERLFTRANPFLPLAVLASAGPGVAALYVPFLRDVLETEPLSWADGGAATAAAAVAFAAARVAGRPEREDPVDPGSPRR